MTQEKRREQIGGFTFQPMDEVSARQIAQWRYAPPYELYSCEADGIENTIRCFLTPEYQYYSVRDEAGELIGFRCFGEDARVPGGDYSAEALDMGGGLRPDRTGQGLGTSFMAAALEFARRQFAPVAFRTTVAAFNQRALRVCERVGYQPMQVFEATHSRQCFVMLLRAAATKSSPSQA